MKITYRTKSLVWSLRKLAAQGLCVVAWEYLTRVHTMFVWQCRSHRNGGERPELERSPMVPVHSLEGLSVLSAPGAGMNHLGYYTLG